MASDKNFSGGAFGELRRNLADDSLVVVALPSLGHFLLHMEKERGLPLIESEVLAAIDEAPAITMLAEHRDEFHESRGFADLDPDNIWEEWQEFRAAWQNE